MQKKYFTSSLEHILAELERIDLLIQLHALQVQPFHPLDDEIQGFELTEFRMDEFPTISFDAPRRAQGSPSLSQTDVRTAFDQMAGDIWFHKAESKQRGIRLRLDDLETFFDLSPLENDIFLICLAPEFDPLYERIYAYLQDDVTKRQPNVDLVSRILGPLLPNHRDPRKYLDAGAPLRKYGLLHLGRAPSQLPGNQLTVDERIVSYLLEVDINAPHLTVHGAADRDTNNLDDLYLPAALIPELAHRPAGREACRQKPSFYLQKPRGMESRHSAVHL